MDALDRMFNEFQLCAYRVETLPQYKIFSTNEFEEFQKYIRGEKIEGYSHQNWLDDLNAWHKDGKIVERVRLIPEQKSDYFEYEVNFCYTKNKESNEGIRYIDAANYKRISNDFDIDCDFWIFDNKNVVILKYGADGEYLDCQLIEGDIDNYIDLYSELKKYSKPNRD